ncbi:MAG: STAS domain-containing protein [Acidimicrobiia bacterium]
MSADTDFCIEVDQTPHVAVLRVRGEIDLVTAPQLAFHCQVLAQQRLNNVVVDATGVTFFDARGVAALIEARSAFQADGTFSLVPSAPVRRLLELLQLQEILPSYRTTEDALSTLFENLRGQAS